MGDITKTATELPDPLNFIFTDMPPMEQEATLRINESVIVEEGQSKVRVWFGPIEPDIAYHMVCLSPEKTHYAYCEQNVNITTVNII